MTTFATELIALLERHAERHGLPRVRALHLPKAAPSDGKRGEFCALELEDGSLGLSYVLLDDTLAQLAGSRDGAGLAGAEAMEIARRYPTGSGAARTVGFAAVNAISRCLFDRAGYVPGSSADSIGQLDPGPDDHIGMIGFFAPLVGGLVAAGARLTVLELKPELAGEHEGYRVTLEPSALATCNKVLSTSTVLLNDTLDSVLAACAGARSFAMIGPGAACLPDPLFARGVTLVGGSWITDPAAFLDALARGDSWSAHARKFAIRREDYPGYAALVAAAE